MLRQAHAAMRPRASAADVRKGTTTQILTAWAAAFVSASLTSPSAVSLTPVGPPVPLPGSVLRQNLTGTMTAPTSPGSYSVNFRCDASLSLVRAIVGPLEVGPAATTTTTTTTTTISGDHHHGRAVIWWGGIAGTSRAGAGAPSPLLDERPDSRRRHRHTADLNPIPSRRNPFSPARCFRSREAREGLIGPGCPSCVQRNPGGRGRHLSELIATGLRAGVHVQLRPARSACSPGSDGRA